MSLKELTAQNHKRAEESWFANELLSGEIDPHLYYVYLFNQSFIYQALEELLPLQMLDIEDIERYNHIMGDLEELEQMFSFYASSDYMMRSTIDYTKHILDLEKHNPRGLLAHLYVRHFGDMFGGAIISKKIPGQGRMYRFENRPELIKKVRALLDDNMSNEANRCFDFAIRLFEDLEEWNESRN